MFNLQTYRVHQTIHSSVIGKLVSALARTLVHMHGLSLNGNARMTVLYNLEPL